MKNEPLIDILYSFNDECDLGGGPEIAGGSGSAGGCGGSGGCGGGGGCSGGSGGGNAVTNQDTTASK